MELFQAIKTRRSVREFNGERIPDDQIREIIECVMKDGSLEDYLALTPMKLK